MSQSKHGSVGCINNTRQVWASFINYYELNSQYMYLKIAIVANNIHLQLAITL